MKGLESAVFGAGIQRLIIRLYDHWMYILEDQRVKNSAGPYCRCGCMYCSRRMRYEYCSPGHSRTLICSPVISSRSPGDMTRLMVRSRAAHWLMFLHVSMYLVQSSLQKDQTNFKRIDPIAIPLIQSRPESSWMTKSPAAHTPTHNFT